MKNCSICGSTEVKNEEVTEILNYKGQTKIFQNYKIYKCYSCKEEFVDEVFLDSISGEIRDFHREVDGLLVPSEIKRIRTSYGFSQEAFGEILGGGKKAFARYENGSITQSKPMDNLLRIINEYPDAISVLSRSPKSKSIFFGGDPFNYEQIKTQIHYKVGT
jgi:HTH-type transcriptional regulator / antitoxin MqsA